MATLITGGTGLMGARIAQKLVERGESPVLFDAYPAYWRIENIRDKVTVIKGDIANLHQLLHVIKDNKVDKIIHLAYMLAAESNIDPLAATHVNISGTLNVYEAGRILGLERICVASSISVYGCDDDYDPSQLPLREDAPKYLARGVPVYAASKVYIEEIGKYYRDKYGVFICGLRPGIVYGWGRLTGATAFAGELIEKPALGQPVKISNGNAAVNLIYIDDVADQWTTINDADKAKFKHFFYNTGGDYARIHEIAETVKKFIPDAKIDIQPGTEKNVSGLAASVSDSLIGEELGFRRKYTPLEIGIKTMIDEVLALKEQKST